MRDAALEVLRFVVSRVRMAEDHARQLFDGHTLTPAQRERVRVLRLKMWAIDREWLELANETAHQGELELRA